MKNTIVTRAKAPNKNGLFIGQDDLSKVVDLFFDFRDGEATDEEICVQKCNGDEGHDESLPHVGIDPAAARTNDRLGMLCPDKINRQVVKRHVDHSQKSKHSAQFCALLAIRQVRAQHEVRNEDQQQNQLKRASCVKRIPNSPDRL